jgi:hypothetical protein
VTIPRKGKDRRKHGFLCVSGRAGMRRKLTTVVCTRMVLRYRRAGVPEAHVLKRTSMGTHTCIHTHTHTHTHTQHGTVFKVHAQHALTDKHPHAHAHANTHARAQTHPLHAAASKNALARAVPLPSTTPASPFLSFFLLSAAAFLSPALVGPPSSCRAAMGAAGGGGGPCN